MIAELSTPTPSPQATHDVMVVLAFLVSLVAAAAGIWAVFRRQPSVDQEFTTKAELREAKHEIATSLRALADDIRRLADRIDESSAGHHASEERRHAEIYERLASCEQCFARLDERTRHLGSFAGPPTPH